MSTVEAPAEHEPYPLRLDGSYDPETSRGLWLVKWLLVVPHSLHRGSPLRSVPA